MRLTDEQHRQVWMEMMGLTCLLNGIPMDEDDIKWALSRLDKLTTFTENKADER